ncbi:two-component system, LytTR family, sensor histidine kinase AgrC [Enterococcus sp. DIV0724b]|uniref:sensor histidine kinase n=1 Tax=Enterococcus sp. DIV0724b TaxID=2774694 RepID=UPI003D2FD340
MEVHLVAILFSFNYFQMCLIIGYKRYLSYRQTIFLSTYLFIQVLIALLVGGEIGLRVFIPFAIIESIFILRFTKSWTLIALYYLLQNSLMLISWLVTWDFTYFFHETGLMSDTSFAILKPISIVAQQLLLFSLLILMRKISTNYEIFNSISQLKKKYIFQSIFSVVLLLTLNLVRQISIRHINLTVFFQLTFLLLFFTSTFSYIVYIISRFYQQQQQIFLLSKKMAQESQKISLANEFRHDYRNILFSLDVYLEKEQFDQARNYLSTIIDYSKDLTETNHYTQISKINIPPIQGLLLNFFEKCSKENVPVHFFVDQLISDFDITIHLVDFIRCLSILLDNAFEASINTEKPLISLHFENRSTGIYIEVKNKSNGPILIEKALKNNFTTKKGHQGNGLPILIKLLKQYPKTTYSFQWKNNFVIASFSLPEKRQ